VVIALEQCSGVWCLAEKNGFKGWIEKKSIWGVYESEELD
jgi:SH3-like domain-containing protein